LVLRLLIMTNVFLVPIKHPKTFVIVSNPYIYIYGI
jgi:hypothetical protein